MKYSLIIILGIGILCFSCKSVPKEKNRNEININEQGNSSVTEKNIEELLSDKNNNTKIKEKTIINDSTEIDETIKEYDVLETDSGYVSVLKKETNRTFRNKKNENRNKTENNQSKENAEYKSAKEVDEKTYKQTTLNKKSEARTEASPDPYRWRYIFGIILIVFAASLFFYIKFFRK